MLEGSSAKRIMAALVWGTAAVGEYWNSPLRDEMIERICVESEKLLNFMIKLDRNIMACR